MTKEIKIDIVYAGQQFCKHPFSVPQSHKQLFSVFPTISPPPSTSPHPTSPASIKPNELVNEFDKQTYNLKIYLTMLDFLNNAHKIKFKTKLFETILFIVLRR